MRCKLLVVVLFWIISPSLFAQVKVASFSQIGFQEEDYYTELLASGDVMIEFNGTKGLDSMILSKDSLIFISDTSNAINKEIYHSIYSKPIPFIHQRFSGTYTYTGDLDLYHSNGTLKLHCEIRSGRLAKSRALLYDQYGYPILIIDYRGYDRQRIEYYPRSFIIKNFYGNGVEKTWYENGIMRYFYTRESRIRTSWYPSGIMQSRSDGNSNEYSNWDSTGSLKTYRCNKFSKKWENGVLKEHYIKDTLGFSNVTYTYRSDGYEVRKIKERITKYKYHQVLEVYTSGNKLLSVDSAELFYEYEPVETNEVFAIFDVLEYPEYKGGNVKLEMDLNNFFKGEKLKKSQEGRYLIRFEINSLGNVTNIESFSTAKRDIKTIGKIEQLIVSNSWTFRKRGRPMRSKMLLELVVR
jgi:hypothetical protein